MSSWVVAQDDQETKPLVEILSALSETHNYTFNYSEETVSDIFIVPPPEGSTLIVVLKYLRRETGLQFQILENNFITVKKKTDWFLCGYLKDKDTQQPLAFATIQGASSSTIANEEGYFELSTRSEDELITIRFIGYRPIVRAYKYFRLGTCAPIFMSLQPESLSQVLLTNYLVEGISQYTTGELEIDFKKFSILPGLIESDVLQTVQSFPGVISINETVSNISIRGGTHDQNLILWDDVKMYQSGHFFGLISAFNPQITQRVVLTKNGTEAQYSDGISGTIAMYTDERVNQKFKGSLGANLLDVNGFLDIPTGKNASLQLAARKSLNDLFSTPTYETYFERIAQDTEVETNEESIVNSDQEFDFYDVSLRLIYRLGDKDFIRANFIHFGNELIFTENAVIDDIEESRESSVSQNSFGGGLFYERRWSDLLTTTVQVYETDYQLKAINANLLRSQRFLQENKVSETGARAKASYVIGEAFVGHFGYQFVETKVTNLDDIDVPVIRSLIAEVVRTHSGFAQVDYKSRDSNTFVSAGLRYNLLDKFSEHIIEPRLRFHQQLSEHFGVIVTGEFKHQITTQIINFQNDFLGVEKRRWQLSNNMEIPILRSKQGAVAFNFNNNGWLVSTEGYYKNATGITTQSQGFQNQYEFEKTSGDYRAIGFDFLLRKRLSRANIWFSYSYMDNQYTFEQLPEVEFPSNLDITHAVAFGGTYKYQKLKIAAGLNWHTGRPTTRPNLSSPIVDGSINYNAANSSRLDDYLRVDVSALYEFELGDVVVNAGASVWNVLDQENTVSNYYRVNALNEPEEFTQRALGLTPNATVRVFF